MTMGNAETSIDWEGLLAAARQVRLNAHAPYSQYAVGAAVLTASGQVFTGCNVENVTFGLTICAERSAIVQMVAAGKSQSVALAVVTPGPDAQMPCGLCRQTLAEFALDLPIRVGGTDPSDPVGESSLCELLPHAFRREVLDA